LPDREASETDASKGRSGPDASRFPGPVWSRNEPRVAGATDVGAVRTVNQDAWGRFDDAERNEIVVVVADGLGGHRGGEVASRLAVDRIGDTLSRAAGTTAERLCAAVEAANRAVLQESRLDPELAGMGTTVVCLLLAEQDRSCVAHVGDSRLYRIRAGRIEPMTADHSLVATLVREGVISEAEARQDPRRNQILRALGVFEEVEVEIAPIELQPGDVFVLCSDGLHGMIDDDRILELADRAAPAGSIVSHLVEAANDAGGADNVTAVVVQIPDPTVPDTLRSRALRLFESTRSIFARRGDA
jgi:protein phosphatase